MVPSSEDENVWSGVLSFVGVVTAITSTNVGAVVSMMKELIFNVTVAFPAASVTVILQSELD